MRAAPVLDRMRTGISGLDEALCGGLPRGRTTPRPAARDGIIVTPTLIKISPSPRCRILGNLKNRDALLHLLGIELPQPDPN